MEGTPLVGIIGDMSTELANPNGFSILKVLGTVKPSHIKEVQHGKESKKKASV